MKSIHQNIVKDMLSSQLSKSGGKFEVGIYILLNIFVAIAALVSVLQGDTKHTIACMKILIMFLIPWLVERKFKIELSSIFIIIVHVFMYSAVILGELDSFYMKYPFWDTMLHALNGFLCASAGFMLVNQIVDHKEILKSLIKPIYTVIFAFCLSMTVGVMWEFYEFGMDQLLNRDMQKDTIIQSIKSFKLNQEEHSLTILEDVTNVTINGQNYNLGGYLDIGLYDTMGDLIINLYGAFAFCIIGYYAMKKDCNDKLVRCFIYAKAMREDDKHTYTNNTIKQAPDYNA